MRKAFSALLFFMAAAALLGQDADGRFIGAWTAVPALEIRIENDKIFIKDIEEDEILFLFEKDGRGRGENPGMTDPEKMEFEWRVEGNNVILRHSGEEFFAVFRIIDENTIAMVETKGERTAKVAIFVRRKELL